MFQRSCWRQAPGPACGRSDRSRCTASAAGRWCCTSSTPCKRLHPARTVVVVGHGAEQVTKYVQETAPAWANVAFAEQVEQRGTGDATATGMAALGGDDYDDDAIVVVVPGDTPLLAAETLDELVSTHVANGNAATLLTSVLDDPTGYGRVVRASDRRVMRIVEQRDASPDELDIKESNMGVYAFRRDLLGPALRNLTTNNSPVRVLPHRRDRGTGGDGPPRRRRAGVGPRDPGRQRPLAARARRARVPQPHQPPLAAQRRDDARSAPDVHRRHGQARARHHDLPGHDPAGRDRRRRRHRPRPAHAARRLRRRPRLRRAPHRGRRRRDRRRCDRSARSPICPPVRPWHQAL